MTLIEKAPRNIKKIKIISRPKLNGLGRHYGVLFDDGQCYELQPLGIRQLNINEFRCGHNIRVDQELPFTFEIYQRLKQAAEKKIKYSLWKYNCESFARYLATGKAESKQVKYFAASSFAAGCCYYLLRSPLNTFLF